MIGLRIAAPAATFLRIERAYLARHDLGAAVDFRLRLSKAMTTLRRYPEAGIVSPMRDGVRRFAVPPYLIEYRREAEGLVILRVWHGRQDEASLPKDEDDSFET